MSHLLKENLQVKIVSSFEQLTKTPFQGLNNAHCWHRNLEGNFEEIVSKIQLKQDITEISEDELWALDLSENGKLARTIILNDLKSLSDFGAQPSLNLLKCYQKDQEFDFISTDVYSWHVDRSPVGTDTYLCTYFGAPSDIISNDDVIQKILIPELRNQLKELSDPEEDFDDFLKENFFDLHYQAKPNAQIINLGLGHLWRLAVDHPDQQVQACVHRAPIENQLRLLLIC